MAETPRPREETSRDTGDLPAAGPSPPNGAVAESDVSLRDLAGARAAEPTSERPSGNRLAASAAWKWLKKSWPWLRYVLGIGLAALAIWALAGRTGELSGATSYLTHIQWHWLVLAICSEIASLVSFGILQQRLLAAGDVRISTIRVSAITVAATAIANSLPGGPVLSSVFAYRQYRHRGSDEAFAAWTLGAVFVAASISLGLVAAAGIAIAGAEGAGFDLIWVTLGVLAIALAIGALFVQQGALIWLIRAVIRGSRRVFRWPSERVDPKVDHFLQRISAVKVTVPLALVATGWAIANWLFDCGCLALSFVALGVPVPWKALLLAYGAGQLAVNLPITPGGLGVVEGSLTIALVIFGGAETQTVAAVLLYRIISFWGELPVGWACWALISWRNRASVSGLELKPDDQVAEARP